MNLSLQHAEAALPSTDLTPGSLSTRLPHLKEVTVWLGPAEWTGPPFSSIPPPCHLPTFLGTTDLESSLL